ncbi:MAG: protein kinase [Acidobacteriia bacterium]|nr:protein kinase [Terriglobia bacterium]
MDQKPDEQPRLTFHSYSQLPGWAHALASVGLKTEAIVHKYFGEHESVDNVFKMYDAQDLLQLSEALRKWKDDNAAELFAGIVGIAQRGTVLNIRATAGWALLHVNDSESVLECVNTEAPREVEIIRVLSRVGSQKIVFEATWRLTLKRVVLKKLADATNAKILAHEASSHPLSVSNPTIIETHFLSNSKNETFLVEDWLPEVLSDAWPCPGIQQAANLLYCLFDAIAVVHSLDRVHGDVKPDNIGKQDDLFILLDFGICRPAKEFTKETTATGSLRTRAPELLLNDAYIGDATKVDIWAIGATVFNFLAGRFPLIERAEKIPRISQPDERLLFEKELERRVREEWDKRVYLSDVDELVQPILRSCLEKDPAKRPSAKELKATTEQQLSIYLRRDLGPGSFAPVDELQQLYDFLPSADILALMPPDERTRLKDTLRRLKQTPGFDGVQLRRIDSIEHRLNA